MIKHLATLYENGESAPQDYTPSLYWYQLAALTRDTAAEAGVERVEQILITEKKAGALAKEPPSSCP
jgi:TPR repeat protein